MIIKIFIESFRQAFQALKSNWLRTLLSLLGIMIGIFCIVIVKSAVDSFEETIKSGFSELGSDVVYLDKMPWDEDPGQNYWKYAKRPDPDFEDFESISRKSKLSNCVSFAAFTAGKTLKYQSNSLSGAFIMGVTEGYKEIRELSFSKGRYFSQIEDINGTNKAIIGHKVANELFKNLEPIGKSFSLMGRKYSVIGVLEEEGDNMFNFINYDEVVLLPLNNLRRFVNIRDGRGIGKFLSVRAKPNVELADLKDELTGIIRSKRRLKPIEDNNFALNEISMLSQILDKIFGVVNIAGMLIGVFALIVGMFSVANIMFVSVKERTNIIGIKKALGAKRIVILSEFLLEAIILCLIGGVVGIFLVHLILKLVSSIISLNLFLTYGNAMLGFSASIVVGVISGIIPALLAASLDPVEAIRQ